MFKTTNVCNYQCLKLPMIDTVAVIVTTNYLKLPMFKTNNNCHWQWLSLTNNSNYEFLILPLIDFTNYNHYQLLELSMIVATSEWLLLLLNYWELRQVLKILYLSKVKFRPNGRNVKNKKNTNLFLSKQTFWLLISSSLDWIY